MTWDALLDMGSCRSSREFELIGASSILGMTKNQVLVEESSLCWL